MAIYKGIEKNRSRGAVTRKAISKDFETNHFEPKPNQKGLWLVKETQNGNLFIWDENFTGYVTPQMRLLREIENEEDILNEVHFVSQWYSDWFYLLASPISENRNIIVDLDTNSNPCITGILGLLREIVNHYENQGRSFEIIGRICLEANKRGASYYNEIIDFYPHIIGLKLYLYEVPPRVVDRISSYFEFEDDI